jgi:uncharacterized membrane protein HdeD (DUF308 family)
MAPTDDLFDLRRQHATGWRWIMAYGLVLLVIGVLALLRPVAAGVAIGLFLGMILVVGGVTGLVAGVSNRGWHSRWLDVVVGILSIVLGVLFFKNPFAGAFSVIWLIAIWAIVIGALELIAAARLHFGRGWLGFVGVVNILLGAVLLFSGPATDLAFLALLVGLSFILRGGLLMIFSWQLRSSLH